MCVASVCIYRYSLAVDISLAALTGDGVFNFGEVLATPILGVLQQTPHAWLSEILQVNIYHGFYHHHDI